VLPFWISIALLSLGQGVLVAAPRAWTVGERATLRRLEGMHSRLWAAIPPLSVLVFVLVARGAEQSSAHGLTYLALCAVPILAALALGWLARGARPALALLVAPLFALAWIDHGGLAGEVAALGLSGLSCVTLGVVLAAVTPARWLAAGIVAMALADTTLVVLDLLQRPNNALNAAHPAAGLPRLQAATVGSAVMGYGDLFIAAVLGALLAADGRIGPEAGWLRQKRAAALVAALALSFDVLFFVVDELPATVPVALSLIVLELQGRVSAVRRRSRPAAATPQPAR
jgi:hypothetical protein